MQTLAQNYAAGRLELHIERADLPPQTLFDFAERQNPRRAFLFVSKVLGRHIPVSPAVMRDIHQRLADNTSVYVRKVLGMKVYDTTAGFKCYRREVLDTMDLDRIRMKGYGFQIEMKYTAFRLGFRLKEVPIIFVDRKEGTSKMSSGIFGEAFWGVIGMRFRKIRPREGAEAHKGK